MVYLSERASAVLVIGLLVVIPSLLIIWGMIAVIVNHLN